ncbi:MAG: molecular chaperone HtpG [Oscillospiraceae bacterium]|nr:molecular chaperone HtpG [Oscillospiraceae bacterium]
MKKKQFKAESKKLLDMMINSIYTHKEIFLRELISNASDAIDKLYFRSLTDESVGKNKEDFFIKVDIDKENRNLIITDNGIGMTSEELENNLGTIAKSGSLDFKKDNAESDKKDDVEIIGQFGVGFYSAFMVSDLVTVESKAFGSDQAYRWTSTGADGYTIEPCDKEDVGTVITLHIKEDTENEKYDEFLETYKISGLIKKYSDYIRYPIKMDFESSRPVEGKEGEYESFTETRTVNSMIPLWRKNKSEISEEEYERFYSEKFYDFEKPARIIHTKTEGQATFDALMFIPKKPAYDYYSKEFEKGLALYSNGVLIMDKCPDLLPDYFSFVRGLVDSADLSLNISREVLQHDHQLKLIARTIEKKIKNELTKMLNNEREAYEEFYKSFGVQLKFGIYNEFGAHKDSLKDLVMFYSSTEKKLVTLSEYVSRMKDGQDKIYYACGDSAEKIDMLPQIDALKEKGYEVLYCTDNVDEFALKMLDEYDGKKFANVCAEEIDLSTEDEKKQLEEQNESGKDMLEEMKNILSGAVQSVKFTNRLKNYPACLSSEGNISVEMEKILNSMPTDNKVKADIVLELNASHPVAEKLKTLYTEDKDSFNKFTKLLYDQARLIGGMTIENPSEFINMISELMIK